MLNIKKTDPFPIDPEKGTKSKGVVPKKQPKKAFSEVLRKEEQEPQQQEEQTFTVKGKKERAPAAVTQNVQSEKTTTLFDIAKDTPPIEKLPQELKESSLSALFKGYGNKEAFFKEEPVTYKPKIKTDFPDESPDIVNIQPIAKEQDGSVPIRTESLPPTTRIKEIQEIVDQIVEKIYTVKVEGKTETVITLKHPPLFSDAKVIVTGFETAKKEFNVSFENLTQEAKNILDLNQDQLKFAMERKGFTLHILTTTTVVEQGAIFKEPTLAKGDQQQEGRDPNKEQKEEEKES